MLKLVRIKKDYTVADTTVHALKGVDLEFRRSEFVSILGPSGCGKTTLLNIIGGLDHYTSGDLIIRGKSTKSYTDGDWDAYRNHRIGFIFQSYNLIPHQTVLSNVELALTIAGLSAAERKKRAKEALVRVGLKDHLDKHPNQLSGGQMQRVAIARALVNDPEILLADEPTGALDTKTSVQIMELIKEIAGERLVIMVTHNPELAYQYSTRIVRLLDGNVVEDSNPYDSKMEREELSARFAKKGYSQKQIDDYFVRKSRDEEGKSNRTNMSFSTSLALSAKNLWSKKGRTGVTAVAGSIGIIGVCLVLAISSGVHSYIDTMENDMLSGYPVSVTQSAVDYASLMTMGMETRPDIAQLDDKVYVDSLLGTLGKYISTATKTNTITPEYVQYLENMPKEYYRVIQYDYGFALVNNLFTDFKVTSSRVNKNPDSLEYANGGNMSVGAIRSAYASVLSQVEEYATWSSMISSVSTFTEVPDNPDYILSQYDVLAVDEGGKVVTGGISSETVKSLLADKQTLVMVLSDGRIDDLTLGQYGYLTEDEFLDYAFKGVGVDGYENITLKGENGLPYSTFVGDEGKKFVYYPNDTVYTDLGRSKQFNSTMFLTQLMASDLSEAQKMRAFMVMAQYADTLDVENPESFVNTYFADAGGFDDASRALLCTMIRNSVAASSYVANPYSGGYSYTAGGVTSRLPAFDENEGLELGVKVILQKKEDVSYGCLSSGFYYTNAFTKYILETEKDSAIVQALREDGNEITQVPYSFTYAYWADGEYIAATGSDGVSSSSSSLVGAYMNAMNGTSEKIGPSLFGGSDLPSSIYIYPVDFNTKDGVTDYMDEWNTMCERGDTYAGLKLDESRQITYTDSVGLIIGMVNTMIDIVTYGLIAFTSISLVVSSVMIGVITYVSVVERTKEIGVLRSLGARKKDVRNLFNAETFIIGLLAGLFGVGLTYLFSIPINLIIGSLSGIYTIASLPLWQGGIMVCISFLLTMIAGVVPANAAARKDPVIALRTE